MHAYITIGISASGKTTFAGLLPDYQDINRDEIRFGIVSPGCNGWKGYKFSDENEKKVTAIQHQYVEQFAEEGENVIISDTNLSKKTRRRWVQTLKKLGYSVEYLVFQTNVEHAIERDSHRRNRVVGEGVIRNQYEQLQAALPLIEKELQEFGISKRVIVN